MIATRGMGAGLGATLTTGGLGAGFGATPPTPAGGAGDTWFRAKTIAWGLMKRILREEEEVVLSGRRSQP